MPQGKTYSKTLKKWIDVETEQKIDYTSIDAEAWGFLLSYWRAFPDEFLDVLESENALYNLELIQRVIIRTFFDYKEVFITGCRGTTKTYCIMLARLLKGVLYPGTIMQYFAPALKQAASIISPVYNEIQSQYPALCEYWNTVSDAKDNFRLETKFGSVFSITSVRGGTYNDIIAEEVAQEESGKEFDFEQFDAVLPAIRKQRMVNQKPDPNFINFQHHYITSAGRQQHQSYDIRNTIVQQTKNGENAMYMDIPVSVVLLSGIRHVEWYRDLQKKLTPEKRLRELESFWTGTCENPVIRDSVLTESKTLSVMEDRHCGDPNVFYIIGYDSSHENGLQNAKCASVVIKCEKQTNTRKSDKYLKSVVYIEENPPPRDGILQARQLKKLWHRFCLENGGTTYIAVDARQYGFRVVEDLHKELNDGLPPLCCMNHEYPELEMQGCLPVIYPVMATGGIKGIHDPESVMLPYAELEFENRNVRLLVSNINEGVEAYKQAHKLKDDEADATIARPYLRTRELCGQIANLRKKVSGASLKEERITKNIQRDLWSATKYGLRLAQIIEAKELANSNKKKSAWNELALKNSKQPVVSTMNANRPINRGITRQGGNRLR